MAQQGDDARFSYDGLDRTIHEKARLSLLASLVSTPTGLSFVELKRLCDLTDGNLSRHVKVLVDAGLVEVEKSFVNNRPNTHCRITAQGERQFLDYVAVLEQVIKDAAKGRPQAAGQPKLKHS